MFESAVAAAHTAAWQWSPDHPGCGSGRPCCRLCFHRYRVLVLDGPLQGLPHDVAHVAVEVVDHVIRSRLETSVALRRPSVDSRAAIAGGLLVIALEELGSPSARLSDLGRCFVEPALARFLAAQRVDDPPDTWV